jgi:glucose/arabinose dehydrogenase
MKNARTTVILVLLVLATTWAVQAGQGAIDAAKALVGTAAFADHRTIKPGVIRKITAADLPAPLATPSATNRAQIIPRPADAWPKALPGFKVDLYASGFESARKILTAPNGDFFVVDSTGGQVKVFRGRKADGTAEQTSIFATGLARPYGIAFYPAGSSPQWVYIGSTASVVRFPYKSGDLKANGAAQTIVAELPAGGGHWTRDVAFSLDGRRMFVAVGSASNVDDADANPKEVHRANILEYTPEGQFVRVYASGIRNPGGGIAVHPQTGELWASTNERDALGDNLVPDYITHVQEGGFYGWPWYYIGGHQDPRHAGKHPELKDKVIVPDVLLQAHNASLGFTFYGGTQFPTEFRGDIFAAQHGSWNKSVRTGYEVIRIPLRNGHATGEYEDFLTGFVTADGQVWGRPVSVTMAQDGSLLVTDDGSNSVWRVSYANK